MPNWLLLSLLFFISICFWSDSDNMEGHKKRPIQWFSRFSITTALRTTKTTSIFIFYTWIWLNRTHNIIALEIPVSRILIQVPHGNAITVITFFTIIDDCSQSVIWIIAWESIWCNRRIITTLMNHSKPCLLQVQWNCKEWDRLLCALVDYGYCETYQNYT